MTVSTKASRIVDQGNGVVTAFSYGFIMPNAGAVSVTYTDASGNTASLTPAQYTITGLGVTAGGTVTYPLTGGPISSGTLLTIARVLPLVQSTSLSAQGPTFAAIEAALDYEMECIQQLNDTIARTVRAPDSDPVVSTMPSAAARANQGLAFDANGNPIAGALSSIPVSSTMAPVFQASSFLAAIQALQLTLHGQCRFVVTSSTVCTLMPYGGNFLVIGGVPQQIPAGGVTLSNAGFTASTLHYIYAYLSSGVMGLYGTTTSHTTSVIAGTVGIETQIGNTASTLVGMVFPDGSSHFNDTPQMRNVASWFNRQMKTASGLVINGASTTLTTGLTEVGNGTTNRMQITSWLDDYPMVGLAGYSLNNTLSAGCTANVGDGTTTTFVMNPTLGANGIIGGWGGFQTDTSFMIGYTASEGFHAYLPLGQANVGGSAIFTMSVVGLVRS